MLAKTVSLFTNGLKGRFRSVTLEVSLVQLTRIAFAW